MTLTLLVAAIGLVGGALSGLLGIGGGIVTAPLLLYLPQAFGQEALSMHVVGGLTISQALFASLFGSVAHWRSRTLDTRLAALMSGVIFVAAVLGAAGSKYFSHTFLLGVFLLLSLVAAALSFAPEPRSEAGAGDYIQGSFSRGGAIAIALAVGGLGGLVGQAGSFVLIPLVVTFLKVPLRLAMGSNMIVIFFAALAGFVGKAATGQVPPLLATALVLGILPGSQAGVALSRRLPTRALRLTLGGLILAACVRMAWDVFG